MTANAAAHLRADELLRLIDRAADTAERTRWERHLGVCTRCAGEAALLRDDALLLRTSLLNANYEAALRPRPDFATIRAAHARRSHRRIPLAWSATPAWLRAAAVLLVVAAPVAAVPSLRAWLLQNIGITNVDERAPALTPAEHSDQPPQTSSPVYFQPAAGTFMVQLDAVPVGGELRVSASPRSDAMLVIENARGEQPVYSEATLRVRNSSASSATYLLQLPASVRTLEIRIGSAVVATIDAAGIAAGTTIPLRR